MRLASLWFITVWMAVSITNYRDQADIFSNLRICTGKKDTTNMLWNISLTFSGLEMTFERSTWEKYIQSHDYCYQNGLISPEYFYLFFHTPYDKYADWKECMSTCRSVYAVATLTKAKRDSNRLYSALRPLRRFDKLLVWGTVRCVVAHLGNNSTWMCACTQRCVKVEREGDKTDVARSQETKGGQIV